MHVLELRTRSLASPRDLIEVFTAHVHDKHLAERGIRLRTFVKEWTEEYVWTYAFDDERSASAFIARDAQTRLISDALATGVVRRSDVDDRAFVSPIIIISAPRSGSTLLYETLAKAPGLWA